MWQVFISVIDGSLGLFFVSSRALPSLCTLCCAWFLFVCRSLEFDAISRSWSTSVSYFAGFSSWLQMYFAVSTGP